MRAYGRLAADEFGNRPWVVVQTDAAGYDDYVHITALVQCLKLNTGESPFWANFGIPAKSSVEQQIPPDVAVARIQAYFAQFFASLTVARVPDVGNPITPTYNISLIRNNGSTFQQQVAL